MREAVSTRSDCFDSVIPKGEDLWALARARGALCQLRLAPRWRRRPRSSGRSAQRVASPLLAATWWRKPCARSAFPTSRSTPGQASGASTTAVSYTHLRAHETDSYLVCRLLLENK